MVAHLAGDEPLDVRRFAQGDAGLFGPSSATWRIHADPSMLVGGLQALLLQVLHPLVMAGVADHSGYQSDPWGRLRRTSKFIATVTYGSTDEAAAAIEIVNHAHRRVMGITSDGRPYDAADPSLLAWVHVCQVWGFWTAYERYGTHDGSVTADQYVTEMAVLGRALGVDHPPETWAELAEYIHEHGDELASSATTNEMVDFLLAPDTPLYARGPYALVSAAAVGLLPQWARTLHRLPSPRTLDPYVVGPAARSMLRTLGWVLGTAPHREAAYGRTQS